jgi:hypothetical protein
MRMTGGLLFLEQMSDECFPGLRVGEWDINPLGQSSKNENNKKNKRRRWRTKELQTPTNLRTASSISQGIFVAPTEKKERKNNRNNMMREKRENSCFSPLTDENPIL